MSRKVAATLSLLALSTLSLSSVSAYALDGAVKATTKWTVGRVASMTQGSYCTMAQKFSDASVVTFAKNGRGEYSLAVDFADPQFKSGEKLKVGLAAQGGAKETFSVTPQSAKTVVVGLGKDAALVASLKKVGALVVTIGEGTQNFAVAGYTSGISDLETCIAGLAANPLDKTADMDVSEKVGVTSPQPEVAKNVIKIAADTRTLPAGDDEPFQKKYPKVDVNSEGLLAAKPTPSDSSEVLDSEFVPVPVQQAAAAAVPDSVVDMAKTDAAIDKLKAENEALRAQMEEQQQKASKAELAASQERLDDIQKKLDMALVQNQALTAKLQASEQAAQKPSAQDTDKMNQLVRDVEVSRQGLAATKTELAAARSENEKLKADMANKLAELGKNGTSQTVAQQSIDALKAENETLRNQLKMVQAKADVPVSAVPSASADQLASLSAQNKALLSQIEQMQASAAQASSHEPAAGTGEDKLRDEVRELRLQVQTISAERTVLADRIETLQKESEHSQLKMAGGSWDLEQATRRYQESQREIRRLGAMIDEQKLKCQQEKKEIEYKLFDPAIASTEQIAMLDRLEDTVVEKEAMIQKIQGAQSTPSPQAAKELADLKAALTVREQEAAAYKSQMEALKHEVAAQSNVHPASYEGQYQTAQQELAFVKKQLEEKSSQMAMLEKQVIDLQNSVQPAAESYPVAAQPASGFQQAAYSSQPAAQYPEKRDIANLLSRAGVSISGSIKVVEGDSPDYRAFSWSSDGLFGSTEMRYAQSLASYEDIVSGYLTRAKSRCDGEFAAIPAKVGVSGADKSSGYEIACVGGAGATSASVLFSYKDKMVTTVAHEGDADLMDRAIDARDRVAAHLN
ncbi:MAG: hypothetical protein WC043_04920 [Pseudobdellovibrionaceae bacterium]